MTSKHKWKVGDIAILKGGDYFDTPEGMLVQIIHVENAGQSLAYRQYPSAGEYNGSGYWLVGGWPNERLELLYAAE